MNPALPLLSVARGAVDVGDDYRHALGQQIEQERIVHRWPRLAFGPAMDYKERRHGGRRTCGAIQVAGDVAFGALDPERFGPGAVLREWLSRHQHAILAGGQ